MRMLISDLTSSSRSLALSCVTPSRSHAGLARLDIPTAFMDKEQEEKLALLLGKAGLSEHFSAFVREKV